MLALYHLEAGDRALAGARGFQAAHPAADNAALEQAVHHFERATEHTPADGYTYRRLGQAWLLAGNTDLAQEAFSRAAELRPNDPIIHLELGQIWDGLGQAEKAVAEYERAGYGPATGQAIVNYLKLADWQIASQGGGAALGILLGKVLTLDPGNLPALYRAACIYEEMSTEGVELARPLRGQLKDLVVDGVAVPTDPRLAEYLAQTMIALAEDGTWTRDMLLDVVAYQVRQFSQGASGAGAERILQTLVQHWPEDADLQFYLGELYQRRAAPG